MPISGDLRTMPLVELLQWAAGNEKSGVLELERKKVRKRIAFQKGRVLGCDSNDPTALLGHVLISKGKISERTLQFALTQQGEGQRLSDILVDMGVVTDEEITREIGASAAETIYGLFQWENAVFRFDVDATLDRQLAVNLSVEHLLLNGAHRQDELQRIREVFTTSGVILRRSTKALPDELEDAEIALTLLGLVDGERTLAEIVLQAHASEYQALRLLFTLHGNGNVEIAGQREIEGGDSTLLDPASEEEPVPLPSLAELVDSACAEPEPPPKAAAPPQAAAAGVANPDEPAELDIILRFASERMERGDFGGALSMLDACYRSRPDDASVKQLLQEAEAAYLENVCKYLLARDRVPVLAPPEEAQPDHDLTPVETSVLGMIDGVTNIQSIVWTAPLREVEVMRTLQALHDNGVIRLENAPRP